MSMFLFELQQFFLLLKNLLIQLKHCSPAEITAWFCSKMWFRSMSVLDERTKELEGLWVSDTASGETWVLSGIYSHAVPD